MRSLANCASCLVLGSIAFTAIACGPSESGPTRVRAAPDASKPDQPPDPAGIAGIWHGELESPGGVLGFGMVIKATDSGYSAQIRNGDERLPFDHVTVDGDELVLRIDSYDSQIEATIQDETLRGTWSKASPKGRTGLPFSATKGPAQRLTCEPLADGAPESVAGSWDLTFTEDDGSTTFVGRAELDSRRGSDLTGTILTDTGDYRFLAGCYSGGNLGLSVFDGAHALLLRAEVAQGEDGAPKMRGDIWFRDSYHASFVGTPIPEGGSDRLADPWSAVSLAQANEDGRFRFAFPDLDGKMVTSEDPRFAGKAVIVEIFGSWCPNCNDQASILSRWFHQYGDTGLEVVGLAYEFSGDAKRDAKVLRSYAKRHRITYPLLLAGTSDKSDAAATLPDLDRVEAYPTTIFIGRDGKVRKIYSGYFGPATGLRHREMITEHEELVHALLAEQPSPPPP